MKNIFTCMILILSIGAIAQNEELDNLKSIKTKLIDSIEKIDLRINYINSKSQIQSNVELEYFQTYTKTKAKIRDKPTLNGKVIGFIPNHTKIKVYDYFDTYWLVGNDSLKGYTNEMYLSPKREMKEYKTRRDEKIILENYGKKDAERIKNHSIWLGMTQEMATLSIGAPLSVNRSNYEWGVQEQWVYHSKYLYFESGKLSSWQN